MAQESNQTVAVFWYGALRTGMILPLHQHHMEERGQLDAPTALTP